MIVGAQVIGADAVAAQFAGAAATIDRRVDGLSRHHRQLLATIIQARVARRTGGLAASYRADDLGVASEHPAAHRREVGFNGRDSLGRYYNDPPRPVVGPAADQVERVYERSLRLLVEAL